LGAVGDASGAAGASVTVAFSSNRRALQFRLPVPLNVSSVDQRGFKYYVESYFGVAGLDVIEDDAASDPDRTIRRLTHEHKKGRRGAMPQG